MRRYSAILAAMSNIKRLEILTALVGAEITVGDLATQVGLSQSALSQHLAKLRAAQLVQTRRNAQTIFYSSNSIEVKAILAALRDAIGEPKPIPRQERRLTLPMR